MATVSASADVDRSYALRMILLGEAGVGKTCLFHWIKYKAFRDESLTAGPPSTCATPASRQYNQHTMQVNISPSLKAVLTVVDTTDREKFQSLTAHYYRHTNIVLLVCSLDDEGTLTQLTKWYRDSQYYVDEQDTLYAVCGLKKDIHYSRKEISLETILRFAKHVDFPENCVFEVSAKTGEGIADMLTTVCQNAVEKIRRNAPNDFVPQAEETSMLMFSNNGGGRHTLIGSDSSAASRESDCCCNCVIL